MNTQESNSEQGKEAKKVLEGFNQTVQKLTAIVKGPENLKLTGKVQAVKNSDGYYFLDAKSRELIEISGNIIITRLPKTSPTITIN